MTRVVLEVADVGRAVEWIGRAMDLGLLPDDVGIRYNAAGDVVVDRDALNGPWIREPGPTPAF